MSIPAGKYASSAHDVDGSVRLERCTPDVAAASGGGWDITFTSNGQLAANGTKTIDATITAERFGSDEEVRGDDYQIDVRASLATAQRTTSSECEYC